MLSDVFTRVLNMSLTANIVILAVYLARFLLKKAPKIYSYLLWSIVLFRLLCPVSFSSSFSAIPSKISSGEIVSQWDEYTIAEIQGNYNNSDFFTHSETNNYIETENDCSFESKTTEKSIMSILAIIWLSGMAGMGLYSTCSYLRIRKLIKVAIPFRKNIQIADDIGAPFVIGIFRPVIYLPATLEINERKYIIAHERHHIRRGDHIFKALGFLALTIHWFNPLVWLAFALASRDMEMSCDEAVIRKYGTEIRADYSASLLNLAIGHKQFSITPLAFGEGNPTVRVRNLANWKKPTIWVMLICVVICLILAICLLTNPSTKESIMPPQEMATTVQIILKNDPLPDGFFESRDEDGNIIFMDETHIVGGVLGYPIPEGMYNPEEHIEVLLYNMGIPDYVDDSLYYKGGITAWGGGWIAEFISDVPEGQDPIVYRRHHFYPIGDVVFDIWFDMNLLDYETTENIRVCINLSEGKRTELEDWGISIRPDRVSRTGATALFVYSGSIPGEEGAELTYGDFLSLDRMVDGAWVPCDELAGYDYYVGDSSYPVVDGYGMVHEWQNRFGELADGHYRIGKQLTLVRQDGSTESRMVYGEFVLPDSVRTGMIPLNELPEVYSAEQAMIDGCFVTEDGAARENKELFQDFAVCSWNGIPGVIRTVNWHYGEDSRWSVYDLSFNGNMYTLTTLENTYTFRYLKQFTGEKAWEGADHDAFDYYVLVNDNTVTFEDIMTGKLDMSDWKNPAHWTVYANLIYLPKQPQLPANPAQAVLEFEGQSLVTTTDFDRLEKIWILFQEAEYLGYEPKTHSVGVGLNLILTSQSGETMTIELNPDSDICRINGEYVFYGAYDEADYIEKLWYYLGIPAWPDSVYEQCPNAYRP